jgi:DNA topoisomerase-1
LKSRAESELRSGIASLKAEESAVLALLRGRLIKEAKRSQHGRRGTGRKKRSASANR